MDVTIDPSGYSSAVTITRPNNATPYSAGDVVGPTAAALEFPNIGPAGGMILIASSTLRIDVTAVPVGLTSFTLQLYSATPPSALADNAVWDLPAGDRSVYLGPLSLGSPVDVGSTLYVAQDQGKLSKLVRLASTSLFAYLCADTGYTPTAQAVKQIGLGAVAL